MDASHITFTHTLHITTVYDFSIYIMYNDNVTTNKNFFTICIVRRYAIQTAIEHNFIVSILSKTILIVLPVKQHTNNAKMKLESVLIKIIANVTL